MKQSYRALLLFLCIGIIYYTHDVAFQLFKLLNDNGFTVLEYEITSQFDEGQLDEHLNDFEPERKHNFTYEIKASELRIESDYVDNNWPYTLNDFLLEAFGDDLLQISLSYGETKLILSQMSGIFWYYMISFILAVTGFICLTISELYIMRKKKNRRIVSK